MLTKYWIFFFLRKKYDLNIDIKKKIKINGILKILFEGSCTCQLHVMEGNFEKIIENFI